MNKFRKILFMGIFMLHGVANAALVERLGGLAYYDTEADLTWLTEAVAPTSTPFSPMTWSEANSWATNLIVSGVEGWRLPNSDACQAYDCTNSEMGNMIYNVLGGSAGSNIYTTHNANFDLFSNLIPRAYWSATEFDPFGGSEYDSAYAFNMWSAYQRTYNKTDTAYAWAVHSGDVSLVPVPAGLWLFVSGLIGLIGFKRIKK